MFPFVALPNEGSVNDSATSSWSGSTVPPAGGSGSNLPVLPVTGAVIGVVLAAAGLLGLRRARHVRHATPVVG
jgi:hypothetical protein